MSTALEDFRRICAGNGIPAERYTTVPGMYSDTLDGLPPDAPPTDISLAYIDCDMYMSTRSVLGFLMPRLKHGMIIAFDDYFCWSSSHVSGERRAMLEFFTDSSDWRLLPYVQYNWAGASFVVEKRLDREPTVQG